MLAFKKFYDRLHLLIFAIFTGLPSQWDFHCDAIPMWCHSNVPFRYYCIVMNLKYTSIIVACFRDQLLSSLLICVFLLGFIIYLFLNHLISTFWWCINKMLRTYDNLLCSSWINSTLLLFRTLILSLQNE